MWANNPESLNRELWSVAGTKDLIRTEVRVICSRERAHSFIAALHRRKLSKVHAKLEPLMASIARSLENVLKRAITLISAEALIS